MRQKRMTDFKNKRLHRKLKKRVKIIILKIQRSNEKELMELVKESGATKIRM